MRCKKGTYYSRSLRVLFLFLEILEVFLRKVQVKIKQETDAKTSKIVVDFVFVTATVMRTWTSRLRCLASDLETMTMTVKEAATSWNSTCCHPLYVTQTCLATHRNSLCCSHAQLQSRRPTRIRTSLQAVRCLTCNRTVPRSVPQPSPTRHNANAAYRK